MIVNDDSSIVDKLSFKLINDAGVIIYDCNRFIVQTIGANVWDIFTSSLVLQHNKLECLFVAKSLHPSLTFAQRLTLSLPDSGVLQLLNLAEKTFQDKHSSLFW